MPEDRIPISEFSYTDSLNNSDNLPIIQGSGGSYDNFRTDIEAVADHMLNNMEFATDLHTTAKKIIPAINEAAQNSVETKSASGSLIHIEDGADNIPVKSLVSQIVAVESGNGQPKSPSNPYTISGFANGVVVVCGKNLFDANATPYITGKFISSVSGNTVITTDNANYNIYKLPINSNFCIVNVKAQSPMYVVFDTSGAIIRGSQYNSNENPKTIVVDNLTNPKYVLLSVAVSGTYKCDDILQIEKGTTPSNFEAYNGNDYTFTFGQTVYGGHFDNKGNLVVTHASLDLGSLTWISENSAVTGLFRSGVKLLDPPIPWSDEFICSCFKYNSTHAYSGVGNGNIAITNSENDPILRARWEDYASYSAAQFKTAMSGQYIVFPLATPTTLSITSQDIPTLSGENNIYADTGDTNIQYFTASADDIADLIRILTT